MSRRLVSLLLSIGLVLSCTDHKVIEVVSSPPPSPRGPTARIVRVTPGTVVEGAVVTFDGSSSSDPDGETLTYRWSTGYQPRPDTDLVYYPIEGSFAISLIVTNTHGLSDTATLQISVENAPPAVNNVVTPAGAILAGTST